MESIYPDYIPEEDVILYWKRTKSVKKTSRHFSVDHSVITRILISNGIFPTDRCKLIFDLKNEGFSDEEIAEKLRTSPRAIREFYPYEKGSYAVGKPTQNALTIRRFRERKSDNNSNLL